MKEDFETLGLRPGATAAEVRAAYISKLRSAHPDTAVDASPPEKAVSDIVRAYRNIAARLQREALPAKRCVPLQSIIKRGPLEEDRARRTFRPIGLALCLVALFAALSTFIVKDDTRLSAVGRTADRETVPNPSPALAPVDPGIVADAVFEYRRVSQLDAAEGPETYSRGCFAELSEGPDVRLLDHCLAFDIAAAHARAGAATDAMIDSGGFFSQPLQLNRHKRAVALFLTDAESRNARLREIEAESHSAIVDQSLTPGTSWDQPALVKAVSM